jgi:RNA polymerase sigma-70 factor (ECF subfamily)
VSAHDRKDEDSADVQRVVAGDLSAFEGIVQRWQGRLVNLAWRFCRDRAMAEDMAQEVFIKAYRSLASFRGESTFSTWLTSIALNTYRSRVRAVTWQTVTLDPARTLAVDAGTHKYVEDRQRNEAVRRAVLTLPERYRDAILMFYFEEKDLVETARALGIAEGTLKARLHRGRELLKRKVEQL